MRTTRYHDNLVKRAFIAFRNGYVLFTYRDERIIMRLIRDEAKRLGYGETWWEDNYGQWPDRLKDLRRVASKVSAMREGRRRYGMKY